MAWVACSASECARLRPAVWPRSSVVDFASIAFQTTMPSTQALIASAKRITIAAGIKYRPNDALAEEGWSDTSAVRGVTKGEPMIGAVCFMGR